MRLSLPLFAEMCIFFYPMCIRPHLGLPHCNVNKFFGVIKLELCGVVCIITCLAVFVELLDL